MSKCFLAILMLCGIFIQHATSRLEFNSNHQHEEDIAVHNKKFHVDYFVLAMQWPQGTCEYMNATHRHKCVVPHTAEGWTLHGLWPSWYNGGHHHLQYCNSSAKFNYEKIKNMEQRLLKYWPNLFPGSSRFFLWKHEYIKHGTCAALVPGFETEEKYFSRAMELLVKYDPMEKLQPKGITPRVASYNSKSLMKAVTTAYDDADVCVQCSYYGRGDVKVVSGLEICLTKGLELMNCPQSQCGGHYRCHGDVYYHPPHFQK